MGKRRRKPARRKIGQVSLYFHHGSWWVYFRDRRQGDAPVRKSVGKTEQEALIVAAQLNAQLAAAAPTLFSFTPVTVGELQSRFVDYHEHVQRSSLATVRRYRSATQHLVKFCGQTTAHELDSESFARHLRSVLVAPNGHPNTKPRKLRDKGVRYILETCRSMYGYAAKKRYMPPYSENPFAGLGGKRLSIEDAKRVFVFDQDRELTFLRAAGDWAFPLHFLLSKTGLRPGEATHLLIEEVDLEAGWLTVRNKPELGWRIKTRRNRNVPLIEEVVLVLRRVIGNRKAGPVFLRERFQLLSPQLMNKPFDCLVSVFEHRLANAEKSAPAALTRDQVARIHRTVWRDAGMVRCDAIRNSFMSIATKTGLLNATCPKSWRHTFATLLQDANVDPLIRQVTLGHSPTAGTEGSLGMTAIYTHTRPDTQKREIERAMRLWSDSLELARGWALGGQQC